MAAPELTKSAKLVKLPARIVPLIAWVIAQAEQGRKVEILPLHEITDINKLNIIAQNMRENGWLGRPILVLDNGDHYQAITGTHRLRAAMDEGVTPEIYVIDVPLFIGDYEQAELYQLLVDARGDEERWSALYDLVERGDVDKTALAIIEKENQ